MLTGIKQQLNRMQEEARKAQVDIAEVVKGEIQRAMDIRGKSGTIKEVIDAEILKIAGGGGKRYFVRQSKAISLCFGTHKTTGRELARSEQVQASLDLSYSLSISQKGRATTNRI